MTSSTAHPAIYLRDYVSPAFEVQAITLDFHLLANHTLVSSVQTYNRLDPTAKHLSLDGEKLSLVSLKLDGKTLTEAQDFTLTDKSLILPVDKAVFTLEIQVKIYPQQNTDCTGLYLSNGAYCTQCESHGFRRIMYALDRPDVLTRFTTRIEADKQQFPQLLSNGNPIAHGDLPDGRHYVTWEDPFKKPTYLFALVAAKMHCHQDSFVTQSGRLIDLQIYVEPHNAQKTAHAMYSLKAAMRWDEEQYGREYDLDIYMIVAVSTFNMGAMENKGLNIFNDKYIVADPASATDTDYQNILQVVGHEYFHNWSGNRVTLRDWFQLSLKEGFTVFRDQCFGADHSEDAVRRIEDVRLLKTAQFNEDAGPMAHPVRPASYIEMNNFYTATVYEKGAELIRMLHTLLGPELFRRGTDRYFDEFDGKAVTTDDFVNTMQTVSGLDLTQFKLWYEQSGTPELSCDWDYNDSQHTLKLEFSQKTNPTKDQLVKHPLHIPVRLALIDDKGTEVPFIYQGKQALEQVISITQESQSVLLSGVHAKTVPSLLRGFSAPVKSNFQYTLDELLFLAIHDKDPLARYEALQQLYVREILSLVSVYPSKMICPPRIRTLFSALLNDEDTSPELIALMLVLPSENYLAEQITPVPVEALHQVRQQLTHALALEFKTSFRQHYLAYQQKKYEPTQEAIAKRAFCHLCLAYLCAAQDEAGRQLAYEHYFSADNMTDTLAALRALNDQNCLERSACLTDFYDKWMDSPLVIDKWLALQASSRFEGVIEQVQALMQHPAFNINNPNKVYSLFAQFGANNPYYFHQADGKGYRMIADVVLQLNTLNPQVAARIIKPLIHFNRYDQKRQSLMIAELTRIQNQPTLSSDLYEIVTKSLES